jgi:D-alanyl-D-alanine carboxypeptidase
MDALQSGSSMQEMVRGIGSGKPIVPQWRPQPASNPSKSQFAVPAKSQANRPRQSAVGAVGSLTTRPPAAVVSSPQKNGRSQRAALPNEKGILTSKRALSAPASSPAIHLKAPSVPAARHSRFNSYGPRVKAKAMMCVDCSSNKVVLADNTSQPLPIASITKLLTAMVVIDEMNLERILEVPADITEVEQHKVGIRPGDLFTVRDLLHGMLIESGNDCAEVLARAYRKGGRAGFMARMRTKAAEIGAKRITLYTPSGLDMKMPLGRKDGRTMEARKANTASAEDVAKIARHAFEYPLIRSIAQMKTYTMRTSNPVPRNYRLANNDKLLHTNLPIEGAKTGYTNRAGRCIVAMFKDHQKEHVIVVLNSRHHFRAAEKIYRWVCKTL